MPESLFNKVAGSTYNLIKKETWLFSCEFCKTLRAPFLYNVSSGCFLSSSFGLAHLLLINLLSLIKFPSWALGLNLLHFHCIFYIFSRYLDYAKRKEVLASIKEGLFAKTMQWYPMFFKGSLIFSLSVLYLLKFCWVLEAYLEPNRTSMM